MASRPGRSVPTRGHQKAPFVSLGTGPYQAADGFSFEGLEKRVFGCVVILNLIVVGMLAEPVVRHFSGDRERLPMVAAADDLDAPTLAPVEEGFQSGVGHCADLVPDDHMGNELLPNPFGRPLCLATPTEEAVIDLGPGYPMSALLSPDGGRSEDERICSVGTAEELNCSRGFAAAAAAV